MRKGDYVQMATTPKRIVEYLRTIDTDYKDNRILTELEHRCLVWYFLYVQNVLSQFSMEWVGCTFSQKETYFLLTTKVVREGVRQVVFTSGRTPIDCVRIFVRKWHDDTLEYYEDQYA